MPRPRKTNVRPKVLNTEVALPDRAVVPRGRIFDSVLDLVGGTPVVRLPRPKAAEDHGADLALKLEFFNPLGSVKDRIGRCAAVEGLPVGISSGAVLHAMLGLARAPANKGKLIVGIAASFAERYLSTPLFAGL